MTSTRCATPLLLELLGGIPLLLELPLLLGLPLLLERRGATTALLLRDYVPEDESFGNCQAEFLNALSVSGLPPANYA